MQALAASLQVGFAMSGKSLAELNINLKKFFKIPCKKIRLKINYQSNRVYFAIIKPLILLCEIVRKLR